ncbi:hypothetical protein RS3R2_01300 [Pseudomonas lactis]|nr:hypothetical protein RS3R2_01300 [Pseudomonas lactis]
MIIVDAVHRFGQMGSGIGVVDSFHGDSLLGGFNVQKYVHIHNGNLINGHPPRPDFTNKLND